MTQSEMTKKTNEKVAKIQALCKELQITISAEEMIKDNIIKKVIYYIDAENYPVDPPVPPVKTLNESINSKNPNVSVTPLQ